MKTEYISYVETKDFIVVVNKIKTVRTFKYLRSINENRVTSAMEIY